MAGVTINYKGDTIATIQGSGSKTLKTQGKYCEADITVEYVKEGITPSGTKEISANGTYDVTQYAQAQVNVSAPAPALVTKNITANGIYNATSDNADGYSSVTVNVPTGSQNSKCFVISLDSDGINGFNELTPADSDIAAHRNDNTLVVSVMRVSPAVTGQKSLIASACGNSLLATGYSQAPYGVLLRSSASAVTLAYTTQPVNGATGTAGNIKVDENGVISIYATTAYYPLIAGTYVVTCGW